MTEPTLTLARVEISIRVFADSRGATGLSGPETSSWIKLWLKRPFIANTVIDTWRKYLDTEQTTVANLTLWPSIQNWTPDLSPSSSPSTSRPSPPTNAGTRTLLHSFASSGISAVLLAAVAGSLVSALTML